MMMKSFLFATLSFLSCLTAFSQTYVSTSKEYSGKVPYEFSPDWQYLSMNLLLLNEDKFNNLLNDLDQPKKNIFGRIKDRDRLIESLDLRVVLKGLKYFNNTTIEFPFFRLKVDYENGTQQYSSSEVRQTEVLTILEDFPLGTVPSQIIELEYKAQAITREKQPKSLHFISRQLKNIAQLTAPDKFILSMVGQFGDYLNAEAEGKKVHWGTTLRAFENKNKNRRIHSIHIYSMRPSNSRLDKGGEFPTEEIDTFMQELTVNQNLSLDKSKLQELIEFERYPVFVIVNYLSKYIPEGVPDNVTHDEILALQEEIREDYEEGNDVKEVNRQREYFAGFLKHLADLRLAVEPFSEKYDGKFDYNEAHATFQVLIAYKKLLLAYERTVEQNKELPEFKAFYPHYEEVRTKAADELNLYPPLKNVAQVVNLNMELNSISPDSLDADELELYISLLKGVELPVKFSEYDEYKSLSRQLTSLENRLYEQRYKSRKAYFKNCAPTEENYQQYLAASSMLKKTKCTLCVEQVKEGLEVFKQTWSRKTFQDALTLAKKKQAQAVDSLTFYLSDTLAIARNRDSLLVEQPQLEIKFRYLQNNLLKEVQELVQLSRQDTLEQLTETDLLNYAFKADKLMASISGEIEDVHTNYPDFLQGCRHPFHPLPAPPAPKQVLSPNETATPIPGKEKATAGEPDK
ncbi:hypothetical protein [Nafulsella turpanensis]|uniref:hypothetical protein n=1 Tax=Nafulsella turpanensis TaxID=1265690 RepID=UPI000345371D|nr:hypothetical protein [Nafulsella turpanensis]